MIEVNLQLLNFDVERVEATVEHLERHSLRAPLRTVTVGDFSCSYRNTHTLSALRGTPAWARFLDWRREQKLELMFQLPLVVKESEYRSVVEVAEKLWDEVDGFVTGDLGLAIHLTNRMKERGDRALVMTTNVLNQQHAEVLASRVAVRAVRPLFHKRTFIEHDVGLAKDVVAFGNMMINCSVFCFHCGDLPTKCDYSCADPKELVMENERLKLVGRSLLTTNRLDLIDRLPHVANLRTATVMDLDLEPSEVADAVSRIAGMSVVGMSVG